MKPRIAIVDYGMGNLRSAYRGLEKGSARPLITDRVEEIEASDAIVLPGVGAFEDAMANLYPLREVIVREAERKPLLGICLGLQLLFTSSEEGEGEGLNLIRGRVVRLPSEVKIPHMGWNSIEVRRDSRLLDGIKSGDYFYFVHSYYALPEEDVVVATTSYGVEVPAIVEKGNVFATQFHPEKSGRLGLRLLKNFVDIARE
ncbi:MAG: imidazole glycerol phosphate synthase subunit HisH [Euryarchaeota archaeon]|nr:imidazole glycerol phosphate synthase subunit HisH [Euryarchaeota archaeon]